MKDLCNIAVRNMTTSWFF